MNNSLVTIFSISILGNFIFVVYIICKLLTKKPKKKKTSLPSNNEAYELAQNNFCTFADSVVGELEEDIIAFIKTGHNKIIRKYSTTDDRSEYLVDFIEACFKSKGYYVYTDIINDEHNRKWEVTISWESVNNEI